MGDERHRIGLYLCSDLGCVGRAQEVPAPDDLPERLPAADAKSRAIVEKMRDDEARHGAAARAAGAADLPFPVKGLMRVAADVMRLIAYRV